MSQTRELRKWIADQLDRGCRPADMVDAMIASGHSSVSARNIMNRALAQRADQVAPTSTPRSAGPASVAASGSSLGAVAATPSATSPTSTATSAITSMTLPEPLSGSLADLPHVIDLPDRQVKVLLALRQPRVLVLGGVLSDEECDALIAASLPKLRRSETVDRASGASEQNASRTSEGTYFFHDESPLLTRINQRIAALTRWPLVNGEPLQILHYGVGAQYEPHYDYFDTTDPGTSRLTASGGQRLATLILYLNDPVAGGATTFPDLGLEVAPVKGNALFFSYDRPHPDTRTLHGGAPVTQGEKWIATRWMRERPYL